MSHYRDQLEEWLKTLPVKADVVYDIGGAQGEVKDRVQSWNVNDYKVFDLPDFDIQKEPLEDQADVIFCLEVFEYLIDPLKALDNVSKSLQPNGRAYITFAFAYPHHEELELDSLRYTETGIKRLAGEAGLEIKNIWYRTDQSGYLQMFYRADGMHPSKNYYNHTVTGFIVEFEK